MGNKLVELAKSLKRLGVLNTVITVDEDTKEDINRYLETIKFTSYQLNMEWPIALEYYPCILTVHGVKITII